MVWLALFLSPSEEFATSGNDFGRSFLEGWFPLPFFLSFFLGVITVLCVYFISIFEHDFHEGGFADYDNL